MHLPRSVPHPLPPPHRDNTVAMAGNLPSAGASGRVLMSSAVLNNIPHSDDLVKVASYHKTAAAPLIIRGAVLFPIRLFYCQYKC